jgi:hypothetical protein
VAGQHLPCPAGYFENTVNYRQQPGVKTGVLQQAGLEIPARGHARRLVYEFKRVRPDHLRQVEIKPVQPREGRRQQDREEQRRCAPAGPKRT